MPSSAAESRAAQPAMYVFDAYNVGWSLTDKKRTPALLGDELIRLWREHAYHAIGLSEIFEIEYPPDQLPHVREKRETICKVLLRMLTEASNLEWRARPDAHHLYIYQASLNLLREDYVSLGVPRQPWRRVQYLCFCPPGCELPLHVYHCHCPSPGKRKRGASDRRFPHHARKTVVENICAHIQQQHALEQHRGVAQPDFPAALLTGDFNLTDIQWTSFLASHLQ